MGRILGYALFSMVLMVALFGIVYTAQCYAWYRMLKLCGYYNPKLAWIPIVNLMAISTCTGAEEVDIIGNKRISMRLFKFWWILMFVLWLIPVVGAILELILMVLCMGWIYINALATILGTSTDEQVLSGYMCATNPILAVLVLLKINAVDNES